MKESADFYLDIMHKDENGKYMVCPSTSPENTFVIDGETCASDKTTMMSASILFDLFSKLIKACEILKIENSYKEYLDNLYIPSVLPDGRLAEWTEDFKESDKEHRHISHLFGLHPGTMITVDETPELAKACENSLNVRGDVGTGWSLAWKVNMWARLKDGNRALKILERQLKYVSPSAEIDYVNGGGTYPNLFDAHPPFQIDGNFGTLSGITEMMLYSRMGYMEILPALPDKFKNGSIKGIKAKGNITVDIFWKNNQATKLSLISPFSQKVTVKVNNEEKIVSLKADKILSLALDK
jgi:alpha-L-fucosidase 2